MGLIDKIYRRALQPCDPSLMGYLRIIYGCLMTFDLCIERGMPYMDQKYADDNDNCKFPLFHNLERMRYDYMACLHAFMAISIVMVLIGFCTKFFNFIFMCGYWYLFILNKDTWNNHSYLFGLFSIMLMNANSNHYWSVDAWLFPKTYKNKHIPRIQYSVVKLQIFLLYFYAGLKKYDPDWLDGYSMGKLSRHWAFDPLKLVFSESFIDLIIVHIGGFCIDLFGGFALYFDKTRPFAFLVLTGFHGLNSQLFSIGMFPYTCIATMFVFCHADSFRKLLGDKSKCVKNFENCVYDDEKIEDLPESEVVEDEDAKVKKEGKKGANKDAKKSKKSKTEKKTEKSPDTEKTTSRSTKTTKPLLIKLLPKLKVNVIFCYMAIQLFLPWSHFITLGYNGWCQGTYGYSWDMMIHSFSTQHVKIKFVNTLTGEDGYLKPDAFTSGRASSRWTSHPDQLWQYATCLQEKLVGLGVGDEEHKPEIYFDVWKTMNKRFNQRVYDSEIDILNSDWKYNKKPTYTLPLLSGYSDWRPKIREMQKDFMNQSDYTEVTFIADFPGMYLENFLNTDLGNTTVEVLDGDIEVELVDQEGGKHKLGVGERMKLPADEFHNVHVIGDSPACYMYIYENTTHKEFVEGMKAIETKIEDNNITDIRSYEPAEGEEKYWKLMVEKQDKLDELKKEVESANKDPNADSTIDSTTDSTTDTGKPEKSDENPSESKKLSDQSLSKEKDKKTPDGDESYWSDRWLRIVEKKMVLFWRSYKLSKFAIGTVFFDWRPEYEEHISLESPNFVWPDWFYKNKFYMKSRIQRRRKFVEQMEEQMNKLVETYGYDEHGNLVPKDELEKTHVAVGQGPPDAESVADAAKNAGKTGDDSPKTEL